MAQAAVAGFGVESARRVGDVPWRRAHAELLELARRRAGLDFEEGRWFLSALRAGTHLRLGYGSFNEYAERLFGYGPRVTQDRLRVAEALEELPELARELRAGTISFSAVREITRVATRATEREWIDVANGRTVREVEQLVSGRHLGSRPDDAPDARARRHVIRLEVSGEVLATFREAVAKIRRDAGVALDDDAAVLLLARHVLRGPRDEGRSSYQVALTVCEECRRGRQQGRGELVEVAPEIVEMAACDEQDVGFVGGNAHVGVDGTPGRNERAAESHGGGADDRRGTERATQSVPPATRRAVLRRDSGRCRVPGCRHASYLDVHHIVPRSDGGRHTTENLVTLCSAHHRAIHRAELFVEGTASAGVRFLHADGTAYGGATSPAIGEARLKARRALTHLGYQKAEAERALSRVPANSVASVEELVRYALLELGKKTRVAELSGRRVA